MLQSFSQALQEVRNRRRSISFPEFSIRRRSVLVTRELNVLSANPTGRRKSFANKVAPAPVTNDKMTDSIATRRWQIPKKSRPMFSRQSSVKSLPVPPLEETCMKYLRTTRPLMSDEEFAETTKAVSKFVTDGSGADLQRKLMARAAEKGGSSWFIDWWNEMAYFGDDEPVVFYVSYFYQFKKTSVPGTNVERAAKFVKGTLKYRELVNTEMLPTEMAGKDPVDMSMYPFLFNSCRLPNSHENGNIDWAETYDSAPHNHVIVIRKNRFYSFDTLVDGKQLSAADIQKTLEDILQQAGSATGPAVGALTSEERPTWNKARNLLMQDALNKASLEAIQTAAMVVCLDDVSPTTDEEKARNIWHGNGSNRFFDKPLQYIVAENGEAGFLGEHCMMDGTPTLKLTEWVLDNLSKGKIDLGNSVSATVKATELKFNVSAEVQKMIDAAGSNFDKHTDMHDLYVAKVPFGKNDVKKCKISPDAFCQMGIQYAFNKVTGERCGTYEACSTRKFLHGRTEVIRSCSTESAAFVDAMQGKGGKVPEAEIYALMQKAATQQSEYSKMCGEGRGVDRHLKGLQKLQEPGQVLDIFADPAYARSSNWKLSTSTIASEHFDAWGFGEVVPDGYGIGYMAKKNDMAFTITSRKGRNSETALQFGKALIEGLQEMLEMSKKGMGMKSKL